MATKTALFPFQNEIQVRLEEDEIPYDMKHSVSSWQFVIVDNYWLCQCNFLAWIC